MKNMFAFGYLMIGFIAGAAFQFGSGSDPAMLLRGLVFFVGGLVLIGAWQWFENTSHARHLAGWEKHHSRGKWGFIARYYGGVRGPFLLLFIFLPFAIRESLPAVVFLPLGVAAAIGLTALAYLGHQEWTTCELKFEARILKEAADRLRTPLGANN